MKKISFVISLFSYFIFLSSSFASEIYHLRVINVDSVYRSEIVHEPVSYKEKVCSRRHDNFGRTVVGGAVGGIIGNQFGKGSGKTAMTIVGALTGATIANSTGHHHNNDCYIAERVKYIERTIRYFEYNIITTENGDRFKTRNHYDVGDYVKVRYD